MIRIVSKRIVPKGFVGLSFGPFIFVRDKERLTDYRLINHETIHFYQQLELLFVAHWVLYVLFYLKGRAVGLSHKEAYRANPFEQEAKNNENDFTYLFRRKLYAWVKHV